ncbi:MAG TPA: hypothetical protein P5287_08030, partial [bacterium]|nr:hypothetical protein [bacterium]
DKDEWVRIITAVIRNTENAYFIFTHGGEMDPDYAYVEQIAREVMKQMPRADDSILMPKLTVYPYISDILGISSGLITLDTGMSHIASGVYDIPTAIVTSHMILHWLPPRSNIRPLIVPTLEEFLLHGVPVDAYRQIRGREIDRAVADAGQFAREISRTPERAEARIAKAAAASSEERDLMDEELCRAAIPLQGPAENVRSFLEGYMSALGLHNYLSERGIKWKELIPPVILVDSAAQTGVGLPRFQAKLHTRKDGATVLLVDASTLVETTEPDGSRMLKVNEGCKKFDIAHEVAGHMVARALFPEFGRQHRASLMLTEKDKELLSTVEEVLARMILFFATYKMHTQAGMPLDGAEKKIMTKIETAANLDSVINIAIRYVSTLSRNECLSTYRHYEYLKRRNTAEAVRSAIRQRYILPVLEMFGDFSVGSRYKELERKIDPSLEDQPFEGSS